MVIKVRVSELSRRARSTFRPPFRSFFLFWRLLGLGVLGYGTARQAHACVPRCRPERRAVTLTFS